jgi:hypothetical protein
LQKWAPIIAEVQLISGSHGVFEVTLDGETLFSKRELKRHANAGEIGRLVEERLGPPIPQG